MDPAEWANKSDCQSEAVKSIKRLRENNRQGYWGFLKVAALFSTVGLSKMPRVSEILDSYLKNVQR